MLTYIVDIDGTICTKQPHESYEQSVPYPDRIQQLNQLFDQGHKIVYWTARGMNTGQDHSKLTTKQLDTWGCKRTKLMMNKPSYDVWIDDKAHWIFDQ